MSAPMIIDDSSRPAIIGMVMTPAIVGVAPRDSCMYWLRNTDEPNIARPVAIEAITESVKVLLRNRLSGISGSRDVISTMMKMTGATIAPTARRRLSRRQLTGLE